jgi:hypothetical protein
MTTYQEKLASITKDEKVVEWPEEYGDVSIKVPHMSTGIQRYEIQKQLMLLFFPKHSRQYVCTGNATLPVVGGVFCILTFFNSLHLDGKKIEEDTLVVLHTENKTVSITTDYSFFALVFEPSEVGQEPQKDVIQKQWAAYRLYLKNFAEKIDREIEESKKRVEESKQRVEENYRLCDEYDKRRKRQVELDEIEEVCKKAVLSRDRDLQVYCLQEVTKLLSPEERYDLFGENYRRKMQCFNK